LSFPVDETQAKALRPGQAGALTNPQGGVGGTLGARDGFPWGKAKYGRGVYGTDRWDRPRGRMRGRDPRAWLLGGGGRVLPQPVTAEYGQFVLSPRQTRELFRGKGWERVVAFQTRNPLHRAHEYALVAGLERLVRAGHFAGAVLNPLIGE